MRALSRTRPVSRISISLPEDLLSDLDRMVEMRGFESRSQAVNDMLHQFLLEHKSDQGDDVMVGIVALFYNNSVPGLQKQLAAREGRNGPVGQAFGARQTHVERPSLLLAPALLGELALGVGRLPALRRQPVEIGMMAADPIGRPRQPGLGRISH